MISNWKQELVKRAAELFARGNRAPAVGDAQKVIDDLHRKIGQLQVERDFLAGQPAKDAHPGPALADAGDDPSHLLDAAGAAIDVGRTRFARQQVPAAE